MRVKRREQCRRQPGKGVVRSGSLVSSRTTFTLFLLLVTLLVLSPFEVSRADSHQETETPIQHMIIIVQENHSFDNYFGTYPTANGTRLDAITSQLKPVNGIPDGVCQPYNGSCVRPELATASSPVDPVEGQLTYQNDYEENGTGFARTSGPQSMVYFDYHSVPSYWDYAEEYGLADNYFAAVLSKTTPNRLMLFAGDTPVSSNYGPPPYEPYDATVMNQLDQAGLSWSSYDFMAPTQRPASFYPFNYISGLTNTAVTDIRNVSTLTQELSDGSGLPNVVFLNALGHPALTEHPSARPEIGENWVTSIISGVMNSSYWNSSAIFLTWDEGGGYYDHVIPPKQFTIDHGFGSPLMGLGQRVPLIVISPFSKENYVSSELLSHLSIIHFIEYNWNMPPLNANVAASSLPMDFFNFSQPLRHPLVTQQNQSLLSSYPIPLQRAVSGSDVTTSTNDGLGSPNNSLFGYVAATVIAVFSAVVISVVALRRRGSPSGR